MLYPPSALDGNQVLQHAFDDAQQCLRVCIVDGTSGPGGGIEVIIDHTEDSIRLGDGTSFFTSTADSGNLGLDVNVILPIKIEDSDGDELAINADGSINVSSTVLPSGVVIRHAYNEVTNVASGIETNIASYVAAVGKTTYLQKVTSTGDCIGQIKVKVDGIAIDSQRTSYATEYNTKHQFDGESNPGYVVSAGQTVTVTILQTQSAVNEYEARITLIEV